MAIRRGRRRMALKTSPVIPPPYLSNGVASGRVTTVKFDGATAILAEMDISRGKGIKWRAHSASACRSNRSAPADIPAAQNLPYIYQFAFHASGTSILP